MIERFRLWLRAWLRVEDNSVIDELIVHSKTFVEEVNRAISDQQNQISELRAEITRLSIAQYVPPSQPEPERKIIKTQTFKQFLDIVEQEQLQQEAREDAIR